VKERERKRKREGALKPIPPKESFKFYKNDFNST
jgi:hypothetical protein